MHHILYKITNNINGKKYVGIHSTDNICDGYMGSGVALRLAYKRYGTENFTREILGFYGSRDEAYDAERGIVNQKWIEDNSTYNMAIGGKGVGSGKNHPIYGYKHTEESKAKISDAHKGENNPNYGKLGEDSAHYGHKHTKETIDKLRELATGRKHPKETIDKLRELSMGRKFSKETRAKIGDAHKGRKHSKEHRAKNSEAHKGIKHTKEARDKISANNAKSKQVLHIPTGDIYPSLRKASIKLGLNYSTAFSRIKNNYATNEFKYI